MAKEENELVDRHTAVSLADNNDAAASLKAVSPALREVGLKLKVLRMARRMSLRDAAERSGLSAAFLSLLERGETEIGVSRLIRLADAYGIVVADLLASVHQPAIELTHANEAYLVPADRDDVELLYLSSPSWQMQPFRLSMHAWGRLMSLCHPAEEFVHCLSGHPTMTVGPNTHVLKPGDTLMIPAGAEHSYLNDTDEPAQLIGAVQRSDSRSRASEHLGTTPARRRKRVPSKPETS